MRGLTGHEGPATGPADLASALLRPLLRADPAGPRITYYDDATGERIELSTATLDNWAAKTANLLRDDLGVRPGSRAAVLLPAHWQTVGVLFGVWYLGAEVVPVAPGTADATPRCDVAFSTAARLDEAGSLADEVVALSLDAFGAPIAGLPFGVVDYATEVRAHGDRVQAEVRPGTALAGHAPAEVLAEATRVGAAAGLTGSDRVLSSAGWDRPADLIDGLLAVYAAGASLVQVAHPDPERQERRRRTEKVTRG